MEEAVEITPVGFATPISLGHEAQTQGRVTAKPQYETNTSAPVDDKPIKSLIPTNVAQQLLATVLMQSFPHLNTKEASSIAKQLVGDAIKSLADQGDVSAVDGVGTQLDVTA